MAIIADGLKKPRLSLLQACLDLGAPLISLGLSIISPSLGSLFLCVDGCLSCK